METILRYDSGCITAALQHREKPLVQQVSFSLQGGESLALIGETGAGKTMIALSILGLLPPQVSMRGGRILFDGQDLPTGTAREELLGNKIVYIPQNGAEALHPGLRVSDQIYGQLRKLKVPRHCRKQEALRVLRLAGFDRPEAVLEKYPFQLSGGMAQRVTIALSLCAPVRLLMADEPTNGLDATGREQCMALLQQLFPTAARIIITHDMSVAALCRNVLVLCRGRMLEYGPAEQILCQPKHPYTQALQGALVDNGMKQTPLLRPQAGECPFYDRCPRADARCLAPLTRHTEGQREWWCNGE